MALLVLTSLISLITGIIIIGYFSLIMLTAIYFPDGPGVINVLIAGLICILIGLVILGSGFRFIVQAIQYHRKGILKISKIEMLLMILPLIILALYVLRYRLGLTYLLY